MQNGSLVRAERRRGPDVWEFRWREPSGNGNLSQIDRAGRQKPYQNITDVSDDPGKTSDKRTQHTRASDVLPRQGR